MDNINNLLTLKDIERIDTTKLSSVDKHYLRLMAYCLASFKEMANMSSSGPFPLEENRLKWFMEKFALNKDDPFIVALLEQFAFACHHLETVSDYYQISPLELSLKDLISFHENQVEA